MASANRQISKAEVIDGEELKKFESKRTFALQNPLKEIKNQDNAHVVFEIRHWPSIFKEHNIMVATGISSNAELLTVEPDAFTDPYNLIPKEHQLDLNTINTIIKTDAELVELKNQALDLVASWRQFENDLVIDEQKGTYDFDLALLSDLITDELTHKMRIQKLTEAGVRVGALYRTLMIDMQKEVLMFKDLLEANITPEEEIKHWVNDSAGHMALAEHLLDPGLLPPDRGYVKNHGALAEAGLSLIEAGKLITLQEAIKYQTIVQEQNLVDKQYKFPSTGHPIIAIHVIKEGDHGLQRLQQLGQILDPTIQANMAILRGYIPPQ